MNANSTRLVLRRSLLSAVAGLAIPATGQSRSAGASLGREYSLTALPSGAPLVGGDQPHTSVWTYNGSVPGPALRVRQGEPVRIVVHNRLDQDTTIHWHGIRLPIAMDGVPGISQPPIRPGESFVYAFTPPDAGTFWYHPHANTLEQLGRGLAGALVVEELEAPPVDREFIWMIMDWRLGANAQIEPGFGNRMEAAMAGRIGNTVTINGAVPVDEPAFTGERVRVRLINAALARVVALRFEGHRPIVVAVDGQPCDPHEPADDRLVLGPAMRVDIVLDMQGELGRRYAVVDDFYDGLAYTLTHLAYDTMASGGGRPTDMPRRLPRNPLPEPDLKSAEQQELVLQGGMMGGGEMGCMRGDGPRRMGN